MSSTKVAVVIPWRDAEGRRPALAIVEAWYKENLPDAPIFLVDAPNVDEDFNVAAARNRGILDAQKAGFDLVVLTDADTVPQKEPLLAAIEAAAASKYVHIPYTTYRYLTMEIYPGLPVEDHTSKVVRNACSGVCVTRPDVWISHAGQDERFIGWGWEDTAWRAVHHAILGQEPVRHSGEVWALRHPLAVRHTQQYRVNRAMARRLFDLHESGDIQTIWEIIAARTDETAQLALDRARTVS